MVRKHKLVLQSNVLCRTGEFCRLEGVLQENMCRTLELVNEDGRACNSSLLGGCTYGSILLVHGALKIW